MKSCENCSEFDHPECKMYSNTPPRDFASKCKHFDGPEIAEKIDYICSACERNIDNYCLRYDHPEFEYNFVKIKAGDICSRT